MNKIATALAALSMYLPALAVSSDYRVSGKTGLMTFVAVTPEQADNEDVYRLAMAEACAGRVC